jgi:excisionase family DNA binding protein
MSFSSIALPAGRAVEAPARALYSPRETESILGISHASLYRLIAKGRLDARKLGSKTLITAESIERLITMLPKVGCRR